MVDSSRPRGGREAETSAPVKAAFRPLLREVRRLLWHVLLLGSGLWVALSTSIEGLVVRLACSFRDTMSPIDDGRLRRSPVTAAHESIARVLSRAEPRVRGWKEQAKRVDAKLLSRSGFGE